MEVTLYLLLLAVGLLGVASLYQSKARDASDKNIRDAFAELVRMQKQLDLVGDVVEAKAPAQHQHGEYNEFNAHVGKSVETMKKDLEVITIRQRSLEKKIIGAERVITVNVQQPPKQAKGRGRSALINMDAV